MMAKSTARAAAICPGRTPATVMRLTVSASGTRFVRKARRFLLAHFADPADQSIRIEISVTAVTHRGEGAVLERQQRRVGAFGRPL